MQQTDKPAAPVEHIVICGNGMAAYMTVAVLARQLPATVAITFVRTGDASGTDLFYGSVSGPTAYAFNRSAGIEEPMLVLQSDAAFSWGTKYDHWVDGGRSWIQSFHLPLQVIDGVMFHHYVAQQGIAQLEPFLVSAMAARKGVFVHPPRNSDQAGQQLLSRAEYGYQFDPASYCALFEARIDTARVRIVDSAEWQVERSEDGIAAIQVVGGERIAGHFFIDCTGPRALLLTALGSTLAGTRELCAALSSCSTAQLGTPMRTVIPTGYGWRSETPLRGRRARLSVFHPESRHEAHEDHGDGPERTCEVTLGRRSEAWLSNCVGLGQAAYVVEPLSIAPLLLMERDIERLLALVPVSADMSVERREYNRRLAEDHEHAELFNQALLQTETRSEAPYWQAVRAAPVAEKLARKIEMFRDRGLLVSYDLEPFHPEDWIILHFGMGRRQSRYDRIADRAPGERVRSFLSTMKRDVEKLVGTLPSHASYMDQLTRYLMQNKR